MKRNETHTRRGQGFWATGSGFTLIELMIVVAIVAILATVASMAYIRHLKSGRVVGARAFLATIQARQATYFQQHGSYCNASNQTTNTNFQPALKAGDEPLSKPFQPATWGANGVGWIDLGARPESDRTHGSFFVQASIAPAHTLVGQAAAAGVPAQPADATATKHPWYYAVGHLDLDGNGSYTNGGCAPMSDILSVGNCTIVFTSSARSAVEVRNEGE